jgi:hypothetical protein
VIQAFLRTHVLEFEDVLYLLAYRKYLFCLDIRVEGIIECFNVFKLFREVFAIEENTFFLS